MDDNQSAGKNRANCAYKYAKIFFICNELPALSVYSKIVKRIALILIALAFISTLRGQGCTTFGQTPGTAFPVCGETDFKQSTVPGCSTHEIPVPGCENTVTYSDLNPFWYKFTCYEAGTLGFLIKPIDQNDDYDWQLYDITGHKPEDVFTDKSLFVSGNWSGTYGNTGASSNGSANIQCASDPTEGIPTFNKMPNLIKDHNYLLLVSHYTKSQSGYSLSFGGGTANITDPTLPGIKSVVPKCDGSKITITLSKKMQCKTLAADASDFMLSPALATIVSASGNSCGNGFDMNQVTITLSNPLPIGSYTLTLRKGSDGNTLLDNCDRDIAAGTASTFDIVVPQPTPMDSITTPACAPDVLQLVFRKPLNCSSIAGNGSDFVVTGPSPVSVIGASGDCDNGIINVQLSSPIVVGGTYQIRLVPGSDGNTVIDECGQVTPPSMLNFIVADTVSAQFDYRVLYGCKYDTVIFSNYGGNGINQWTWDFDDGLSGSLRNAQIIYSVFGRKEIHLMVSNGVCTDTASAVVSLDNELKAAFEGPEFVCPEDKAVFKNNSIGNTLCSWDFGDGTTSNEQTPPDHSYPITGVENIYTVTLIVQNHLGCLDTAQSQVKRLRTCYITVPSAFTPNGDGMNDFLYPLNAYKADNLQFRIFNRFGQLVFATKDWTKKWDGTIHGAQQPTGTYVWMLEYTDRDSGQKFFKKGTTVLIR